MGHEVEKIAMQSSHSIAAKLDSPSDWKIHRERIIASDVIIDFTQPNAALQNIYQAFKLDKPMVIGTTGWDDKKEDVRRFCLANNQELFVA